MTVPESGGIQVNFTLDNAFFAWSQSEDFGILDNLEGRYIDDFELHNQLIQLSNENQDLVKPMANFGAGGLKALNFVIISSQVCFVFLACSVLMNQLSLKVLHEGSFFPSSFVYLL